MMKDKNELIEYQTWYDSIDDTEFINKEPYEIVEMYLYSIDSYAQSESQDVSSNESQKKFIKEITDNLQHLDSDYVKFVNENFWELF